ncbi:hypothetical protein H0H92_013043, partial [Tricholoma furcatifolium]
MQRVILRNQRPAPYPRIRPTALNRAQQERLAELKLALDGFNDAECPVTFDDATQDWIVWQRPIRVFANGSMTQVAASGFKNIFNGYTPPICPHINLPDEDRKMELHLQKPYK